MLYEYGLAVSEERGSPGRNAKIERYLNWEYRDGTAIGYLLGGPDGSNGVASRRPVHGRFGKWLGSRFRAGRRAVGRAAVAPQGAPKL